jgi:Uma2 family endonuclease
MPRVKVGAVQRLVLYGEPWSSYTRLLRMFEGRRRLRITYDRGALEIMTVSPPHEHAKQLLGRFIEVLTEELGLPLASYGNLTMRRRRRQRGLEPDQCYWIQNEGASRNLQVFDLRLTPPPDLVIEVEVSRSALNRMGIYAALGAPEVWCFDGQALTFQSLGPNKQYAPASRSRAFPQLAPSDLVPFLALRGQVEENALIRQFRAWVRQSLGGGASTSPTP